MKKFAIVNATIVRPDHIIPNGTIVIEDGIIRDFGKKIDVTGMKTVDAGGAYVGPGLIDIHTHAGNGPNEPVPPVISNVFPLNKLIFISPKYFSYLMRPFDVLFHYLSRISCHHRFWRHVFCNHRTCRYNRAVSYRNPF